MKNIKNKSKIKRRFNFKKSTAPKYWSFNLNHHIRVKLTELGYQKLTADHNKFVNRSSILKKVNSEYYKNQADKYGYTKFQMWDFIQSFGEVTGLCRPPHYHLDILISQKDLEDYK